MSKELVIIDTDPGIDDFMALMLALAVPDRISILGLTVVFGNHHDMDLLVKNACFTLAMGPSSLPSIPVLRGASSPLQREFSGHSAIEIHGQNGLGNLTHPAFEDKATLLRPALNNYNEEYGEEAAARFIVDTCSQNPGNVSIITLGPLTNIAKALQLCPELPSLVKQVVCMGGAIHHRGNITPSAEANIYNDPEAARIAFKAGFKDFVLVPIDNTSKVYLNTEFRETLRSRSGDVGSFIYELTEYYIQVVLRLGLPDREIMPKHDPTTLICFLRPDLFEITPCFVDVETQGELTTGATIADWRGKWGFPPNVRLAMRAKDPEAVKAFYVECMAKAYGKEVLSS